VGVSKSPSEIGRNSTNIYEKDVALEYSMSV
jgi:hypothetical protein